ncbi:MAG: hypothetical protein FJX52_10520 [Alphaproteobacteria bacterium]|nr:hypothetical protein [Alphaproteobacteria bacterium]
MRGGDGTDVLSGGAGNDTLFGNDGSDDFRLGVGESGDTIADFSAADRILAAGASAGTTVSANVGTDATSLAIDVNGDGAADATLTLTGVLSGTFSIAVTDGIAAITYVDSTSDSPLPPLPPPATTPTTVQQTTIDNGGSGDSGCRPMGHAAGDDGWILT